MKDTNVISKYLLLLIPTLQNIVSQWKSYYQTKKQDQQTMVCNKMILSRSHMCPPHTDTQTVGFKVDFKILLMVFKAPGFLLDFWPFKRQKYVIFWWTTRTNYQINCSDCPDMWN